MKMTRLQRLCVLHSQQGGTIFDFNRLYGFDILDLSDAAFERRFGAGRKQWVFNWAGGGYNSVSAETKAEALKLAREISKNLVPSANTFRVVEAAEMNAIDRAWNQD